MAATSGQMSELNSSRFENLEPYKHPELPPERSWIRVAAVKPYLHHADELMEISFVNVRLDNPEHREYAAISYAWGSQIFDKTVICEGRCMKITTSLFSALCDLRQSKEVVYLWADAVCIDQTSPEERQSQVRFMDRIFSQASQVYVYLGAFSAQDKKALAAITTFAKTDFSNIDFSSKGSLGEIHTYLADAVKDLSLPDVDSDVWGKLEALMIRPWFTRLWIVQEYAMAREVFFVLGNNEFMDANTFRLGTTTAIWYHRVLAFPMIEKLLSKGFTAAETVALWIPRYSYQRGYYVPIFRLQKLLKMIASLVGGGSRFTEISNFRGLHQASKDKISTPIMHDLSRVGFEMDWRSTFGTPWWKFQKHTFFSNLIRTRQFATTDSHDRVYALLGLCSEKGIPALQVNYEQPIWQLAEKVSVHLLRRGHGVHMLTAMSLSTNLRQHGWRISLRDSAPIMGEPLHGLVSPMGNFENSLFRAGGYEEKIQILSDGENSRPSIAVSGVRVGRLVSVCQAELPELVREALQAGKGYDTTMSWWEGMKMQIKWYNDAVAWLREIETWILSLETEQQYFELNCWRALCCGVTLSSTGQRELIGSKANQFDPGVAIMKCKEAYRSLWSLFWRFMNQNVAVPWDHISISGHLRLSMDSAGRICTVPVGCEAGDLICIFKGFPLPFILRPTHETTYDLLGAAYVQGVMDGDLFDETYRRQPEDFVLNPGPEAEDKF